MKRLLIIWVMGCGLPVLAQDPVEPYLQLAAENNPGLKSKFQEYLAVMEQIPQSQALPDPQLGLGVFLLPVETRVGAQKANLGISQSFPWFGTLKSRAGVNSYMAEAKLVAFENEKLNLFRQVRLAYNQLYFLHKAIRLTAENLQLLNSFKELARVNFESGKTGFVNVLRVEMEEEELQVNLIYLQESEKSALSAFENLINHPLDTVMEFPEVLQASALEISEEHLMDSVESGNLELQVLDNQVRAKQEQENLARFMSKPSFRVGANYINISKRSGMDISDNGKDAILFPQVGISIPLARKKYQAMQKQAQLEKDGIEYKIAEKANQFNTQLQYLSRDYADAGRRITLYQRLFDLAERSLSLLQTEFATGKTDFEEVLRMQRKLLNYQLQLEKARVDLNNAVYDINYIVGK